MDLPHDNVLICLRTQVPIQPGNHLGSMLLQRWSQVHVWHFIFRVHPELPLHYPNGQGLVLLTQGLECRWGRSDKPCVTKTMILKLWQFEIIIPRYTGMEVTPAMQVYTWCKVRTGSDSIFIHSNIDTNSNIMFSQVLMYLLVNCLRVGPEQDE